jgi:beta-galactosidase
MKPICSWFCCLALLVAFSSQCFASLKAVKPRGLLNLDGQWQIEQSSMEVSPGQFSHTISVPGLVDMAKPEFVSAGKKSELRQAFWYRRTFKISSAVTDVALLKVNKACYGTKVFINGQVAGEHLGCFTPGYFNLKPFLKAGENELIIRVGADRESLPKGMPTGWDAEKYLFTPGIYDSVEVILASTPYIVSVQAAPEVDAKSVRVAVEIDAFTNSGAAVIKADLFEVRSGRKAGEVAMSTLLKAREVKSVEFVIPIDAAHPWTPEDPFLYELRVSTKSDAVTTRFGLRSFGFDGKYAKLNGKRYFLRGSNLTLFRFFEDAERGDKPWRESWVQEMHQKFKTMHWNTLHYCLGFPPEFWYDIADEEGFLIQDEFPIWASNVDTEKLQAEKIIPEYTEWMRERWNHPSVVIWDAQNESLTKETGEAIQDVRRLDLSNRPWENGWGEPQSAADCVEAHPYRFNRDWSSDGKQHFSMSEFAKMSGVPELLAAQKKIKLPIIIDEYGWLWLTRDGNPTALTAKVYENLLGTNSTVEQRRVIYAKYLAAKTEFWRAQRECAGVLEFCALGYSRAGDKPRPEGGSTSDHWLSVSQLKFEPNFAKYVGDAFNPIGVMLNFWEDTMKPGVANPLQIYIINDLEPTWTGKVYLYLFKGGKKLSEQFQTCTVESFGRQIVTFTPTAPSEPGEYTWVAELEGKNAGVRSVRDFKIP